MATADERRRLSARSIGRRAIMLVMGYGVEEADRSGGLVAFWNEKADLTYF